MANQYTGKHGWTDERIELLKHLVREGYSGGMISARLKVTRSSAIGKIHRLGLQLGNNRNSRQKSVAATKALRTRKAARKAARLKAPIAIKFPVEALPPPNIEDVPRKKLADLEPNDCRFPIGEVGHFDFGFCALERIAGSSYCHSHTVRTRAAPLVRKPNLTIVADTSAPVKEGADA